MSKRLTTGNDLERMLRDHEDRIARIERALSVRVGTTWRLEVDGTTGDLIATHVPTGTTTVLAVP